MTENKPLSLSLLNSLVKETLEFGLPDAYWVEAELAEVREWGGHCYMDLVEKEPRSNTPIARASARCWRQTWAVVKPHFERATGQRLSAGMKVLVKVRANFHEAYGFAWIVVDIDPTFSLGDLARRRMEIVQRLKAEGVFELNKELPLAMPARRIAVVTSAGAAGYGDFVNQLESNAYGYRFAIELFEATMQGEQVEPSVIAALNRVASRQDDFDCVVIIRGGGATSDLSGFDTLALAENVANFPLPVITGIGHERDTTVLDMVAHTCVKTPTAAAAMLIDRMRTAEETLDGLMLRLVTAVQLRLRAERMRLERAAGRLPTAARLARTSQTARISLLESRLTAAVRRRIDGQNHRLELLEQRAKALDPAIILRRGFSITRINGHAVHAIDEVNEGDTVVTQLANGTIKSTVTWTSKN